MTGQRQSLQALRSLSRAMFRGFVRDRTALVFSILIPVLFLVLFGSIYKSTSAPKVSVIEVGRVSLLDQAGAASHGQLGKVMTITRTRQPGRGAAADVRKGTDDAAVQQQGSSLVVHYSIADQTTAGIVQAVFSSIVQQANLAATGRPPAYQLTDRAGRGQVAEADPVPGARPAGLGDRLGCRVRRRDHAGRAGGRTSCCAGCAWPR